MINRMVHIVCLFFCIQIPFSCKEAFVLPHNKIFSQKLYHAYSLYIAIIKKYKDDFVVLAETDPTVLQNKIHTMVINSNNRKNTPSRILSYKKVYRYRELPYIQYKETINYLLDKIDTITTKLSPDFTFQQAAILHCLCTVSEKLRTLNDTVARTPNYYQEKIKIASVKEPFFIELLKITVGFVFKKTIPF